MSARTLIFHIIQNAGNFYVCTRSDGARNEITGNPMSTGGEMLVSRYRPLFIFAALAPVLNYLGHAFFGWKLVSMDFIEYLPTTALPDARLSDSWNSYMAVAQFLLLITGTLLVFTLFRQLLSGDKLFT